MNMRNVNKNIIISIISFISIAYIASPLINIILFINVLKNNKVESFKEYIEFTSLRNHLKKQFTTFLTTEASNRLIKDEYSNIKLLVLSPVISSVVNMSIDSTITPKGIYSILNTGIIPNKFTFDRQSKDKYIDNKSKTKYSFYYE